MSPINILVNTQKDAIASQRKDNIQVSPLCPDCIMPGTRTLPEHQTCRNPSTKNIVNPVDVMQVLFLPYLGDTGCTIFLLLSILMPTVWKCVEITIGVQNE